MSMPGCLYYTMLCYKAPTLPWKHFASFEHGQTAAAFRARLSLFWSFGPVPHAAQSMGVMRLFHIDQQRQKGFPVLGECMDCFFIWCFPRIPAFLCSEGLPRRLSGASCGSLKVLDLCSFLSILSCEYQLPWVSPITSPASSALGEHWDRLVPGSPLPELATPRNLQSIRFRALSFTLFVTLSRDQPAT